MGGSVILKYIIITILISNSSQLIASKNSIFNVENITAASDSIISTEYKIEIGTKIFTFSAVNGKINVLASDNKKQNQKIPIHEISKTFKGLPNFRFKINGNSFCIAIMDMQGDFVNSLVLLTIDDNLDDVEEIVLEENEISEKHGPKDKLYFSDFYYLGADLYFDLVVKQQKGLFLHRLKNERCSFTKKSRLIENDTIWISDFGVIGKGEYIVSLQDNSTVTFTRFGMLKNDSIQIDRISLTYEDVIKSFPCELNDRQKENLKYRFSRNNDYIFDTYIEENGSKFIMFHMHYYDAYHGYNINQDLFILKYTKSQTDWVSYVYREIYFDDLKVPDIYHRTGEIVLNDFSYKKSFQNGKYSLCSKGLTEIHMAKRIKSRITINKQNGKIDRVPYDW